MEGCEGEKVVRERAPHRRCRQGSVSLSIPSVTLQLSALAYSIRAAHAHAHIHTYTEHVAVSAHGEEGQWRESERRKGEGV